MRLGHSSHAEAARQVGWLIDSVFGERALAGRFAAKRFHAPPLTTRAAAPFEGLILSHDPTTTSTCRRSNTWRGGCALLRPARRGGHAWSIWGVQPERVKEFDWWQSGAHDGVRLTATPAQHFSGRTLTDRNRTLWASWVIESGEQRIFYSGDSGYFGGFKEIGARFKGFDLALMENGAYDANWPAVHMTPEETVQAFQDLNAKVLSAPQQHVRLAFTLARPPRSVAALAERSARVANRRSVRC